MSNEEYIASGILELYAAGGLTPEERKDVALKAAASAEIQAALDEACAAMDNYAQLFAITPPSALKDRILSSIQPEINYTVTSDRVQEKKVISIYPPEPKPDKTYKWMLAASVGLFLVTGALSLFFYSRWQQAEDQLALVSESELLMAQNMETVSLKTRQLEETLLVLRNPDFKSIRLESVKADTDANMVVYWNPQQQQVYVDVITLPTPPDGMQYQLWALDDGNPVDAGMLPLQKEAVQVQKMKPVRAAQAFAVTLERVGGSKTPNLDQLMVMGEVKA